MGQNIRRTALGQMINIDQLRIVNETSMAVGNMNVNARGDQVAPNGNIIKTRNEIMKEHYKSQDPVVKYNPNKRRQSIESLLGQASSAPAPTPVEELTEDTGAVPTGTNPFIQNSPDANPSFAVAPNAELRQSLAQDVTIDLTEPTTTVVKSLKRI